MRAVLGDLVQLGKNKALEIKDRVIDGFVALIADGRTKWDEFRGLAENKLNGVRAWIDDQKTRIIDSILLPFRTARDDIGGVLQTWRTNAEDKINAGRVWIEQQRELVSNAVMRPFWDARDAVGAVIQTFRTDIEARTNGVRVWLENQRAKISDSLMKPFWDSRDAIGGVLTTFKDNLLRPLAAGLRGVQSFVDGFRSAVNSIAKALGTAELIPAITVPTIPGYHTGTHFHPGGPAIVDEKGKEPINIPGVGWVTRIDEGPGFLPSLPRGAQVMPYGAASRMLAPGGAANEEFEPAVGTPKKWSNGLVTYMLAPGFTMGGIVESAARAWEAVSGVRFDQQPYTPRTTDNRIVFAPSSLNASALGMQGGTQMITLVPGGADSRTAIHEIGHALGLDHEHQRYDRDRYIQVFPENIDPKLYNQFDTHDFGGGPYDPRSIMHYWSDAGSINGQPTMLTKAGGWIARQTAIAPIDIAHMRQLYGTTPAKVPGHDKGIFDPITGALSGIWDLLSGGADAAIDAVLAQFGVSFELPGMLAPLATGVMSKARSMAVDWLTGAISGAGGEPYIGGGIQAAIQAISGGGVITNRYWNANAGPGGGIHGGTDFGGVPVGTPIWALFGGRATPGFDSVGGNWSIVTNPSDQRAYYGHALERMRAGLVRAGDVIGRLGYTGLVIPEGPAGAHLHFQMTPANGGAWGDPEVLLGGAPVVTNTGGRTKAFANGGVIDQMIWGIGQDGTRYTLGERGPEYVIPADRMQTVPTGAAAGEVQYNQYYQIEAHYEKVEPEYELRHLLNKLRMQGRHR